MDNYNNMLAGLRELVDNPTPRVPVALCLDVSGSMRGQPIQELQQGLTKYRDEMIADEMTRFSAETALITFSTGASCISDFCLPDRMKLPLLDADGLTAMGSALNLALERLEARKQQYRSSGIDYYQPILVVMTDGQPTDPLTMKNAVRRVRELAEKRKLTVIAVGIGPDADMDMLQKLCVRGRPVRLNAMQFQEFFAWLSASVSGVSASTPGEEAPLDLAQLAALEAEPWPADIL